MGQFLCANLKTIVITTAAAFGIVIITLFCLPVVHIDQRTCEQIRPGMSLDEVQALIGGPPHWYDGVWGINTDAPPYKSSPPTWTGGNGEIIVNLDDQKRVSKADFYPAKWVEQSISRFAWERVTRNAFGTGRIDIAEGMGLGFFLGLLLVCPIVLIANAWRWRGMAIWAYGLYFLGVIASLGFLVFAIDMASHDGPFAPLGVSVCGLIACTIGCVVNARRRPHPTPIGLSTGKKVEL